ncbi:MAG: aldehyde dehydrogenase family protein, partial [Inquilinus sp.]|nr:aldehyde dehydrogenase family protein [Inquilinus sp.]
DELAVGNPWSFATDVGPVISGTARREILAHIETARTDGRLLKQLDAPETGHFVGPAAIRVGGIEDLAEEIFGPVLHIATFRADQIDGVVDAINASGYGLTFGLHSRIDDRVEQITTRLKVGNIYINRNQIGAIVGSQPFGGEGLSGTGPKAGGPHYVPRFTKGDEPRHPVTGGDALDRDAVQAALDAAEPARSDRLESIDLPGPTGESNRFSLYPRGLILCLGPTAKDAEQQAEIARSQGCSALAIAPGTVGDDTLSGVLDRAHLTTLRGFDGVALWSEVDDLKAARQALAARHGPLIPLVTGMELAERCVVERHVSIDTTAAGGNASLLAANA